MAFDASRDFGELDIKFDVVFSNACIQWVPNHKKLLADIMSVLNDGGKINRYSNCSLILLLDIILKLCYNT